MSAESRGWGPGWPTDRRADMAKITDGGDVVVYVHKVTARLFAGLMMLTEKRGYSIKSGQTWGYAGRYIRGTKTPSNHSWGLAIDINSTSNPMGDKLVTDMPKWMVDLWKEFMFRWGGSYSGRKDAMHFEFMGSPADAQAMEAKFYQKYGGELGSAQPPASNHPPQSNTSKPAPRFNGDVQNLQSALGLTTDGIWGPRTEAAVKKSAVREGTKSRLALWVQQQMVQDTHRLDMDGHFGPASKSNLIDWQRARGLAADGVAGYATLKKMALG